MDERHEDPARAGREVVMQEVAEAENRLQGTNVAQGPDFLVHNEGDDVAVAVSDIEPGPAQVRYMDSGREAGVEVTEPIPLGHKVALVNLAPESEVREYGVRVAITRTAIPRGSLAHVHNLRSARWEASR